MPIDYGKLHIDIRRDSANKIAADLRNKERAQNFVRQDTRNKDIYEKGIAWFNTGFSLEDAPADIKNNTNFINGYEKGKRLALIASLQEEDSKKHGR